MVQALRFKIPTWVYRVGVGIFFAVAFAAAITRHVAFPDNDFAAYYRAAERILDNTPFYRTTDRLPFKYPPITAYIFTPLALVSYSVSKWFFTLFHFFLLSLLPLVVFRGLVPSAGDRLQQTNLWLVGIILSFTASLRFLEIEFRCNQVAVIQIFFLILGAAMISSDSLSPRVRNTLGVAALTYGALLKVHSLLIFLLFFRRQDYRKVWLPVLVVLAFLLIPDPRLWLDWIRQIRETTGEFELLKGQYFHQGIYGFSIWYLDGKSATLGPMVLLLPFLVFAWFVLPRFRWEELPRMARPFFSAVSCLTLLGVMASPLAWPHTYAVLFGIFLIAWLNGTDKERVWVLGFSLFLGLTAQGIIGKTASRWLEARQSVFFACALFWILLALQARRLYRLYSMPSKKVRVPSVRDAPTA